MESKETEILQYYQRLILQALGETRTTVLNQIEGWDTDIKQATIVSAPVITNSLPIWYCLTIQTCDIKLSQVTLFAIKINLLPHTV